jgi:transcriptional regulator with XRE-family HTH domain
VADVSTRPPELLALGRVIREARVERGLSQEALADRAGLHRTYVGGIERGERNVAFLNILKLARALDLPASALLERCERTSSSKPR